MPTKLGFQLHAQDSYTPNALDRLRDMQPAALLVFDDVNLLNTAYDTIGAGPVYIFRQRGLDDPQPYLSRGLESGVDKFLQDIEPAARALPWAYHCTFRPTNLTPQLTQFEALAMEKAQERLGIRLCIGNFAPGTPDTAAWSTYRPALEAAIRYDALIGLREVYPLLPYVGYGPSTNIPNKTLNSAHKLANEVPYPQGYQQPGALVGRYRFLRDYCRQQKLPVQIVITESGAGRIIDDWLNSFASNLSGWNSLASVWQRWGFTDAQTHYFQDLAWMDQHVYNADPEVLATCVFAWNAVSASAYEIGTASKLLNLLQNYIKDARRTNPPRYQEKPINPPATFKVLTARIRIRPIPSVNTKHTGGMEYGETFTGTHYAFTDGLLWVKHTRGWTAYAPLNNGNPQYEDKLLEGPIMTTPQQDAAANNFVATLSEVRAFLQAHQGQMFYIAINPGVTPEGARHFSITTFPVNQGRRILDQLHPQPGNPRMSPEAKKKLIEAGQL